MYAHTPPPHTHTGICHKNLILRNYGSWSSSLCEAVFGLELEHNVCRVNRREDGCKMEEIQEQSRIHKHELEPHRDEPRPLSVLAASA